MHIRQLLIALCATMLVTLSALYAVERKDNQPLYRDHENKKGVVLEYSIQTPRHQAGDPGLPLLVLFHGTNLTAEKEVTWTNEVLEVMGLRDSVILLAPQGGSGKGPWNGRASDIALLIEWAKSELPVDPRRMIFAGFSAGANFSMNDLYLQHRDELAGVIGYASIMWKINKGHRDTDPDIITLMGTSDKPAEARKGVATARKAGFPVTYREIIGAGHGTVLGLPNTRESRNRRDLITWSLGQRCRSIPPNAGELAFLAKLVQAKGRPSEAEVREVVRIGGAEAGQLVNLWLQSNDAGLQLAAARVSQSTLFDGATIPGLSAVAASGSSEAAQAAAIALGHLAAWRYEDARKALVELAQSRKAETRAIAALGLKEAIAFTIYGQHEDQSLFVALVRQMSDPEVAVRRLAWAALSQEMPPVNPKEKPMVIKQPMTYNPDQEPRTQSEIIAKWQDWVRSLPESL